MRWLIITLARLVPGRSCLLEASSAQQPNTQQIKRKHNRYQHANINMLCYISYLETGAACPRCEMPASMHLNEPSSQRNDKQIKCQTEDEDQV